MERLTASELLAKQGTGGRERVEGSGFRGEGRERERERKSWYSAKFVWLALHAPARFLQHPHLAPEFCGAPSNLVIVKEVMVLLIVITRKVIVVVTTMTIILQVNIIVNNGRKSTQE